MCSKFSISSSNINAAFATLNYPTANIQTEINYPVNQACWIRQMNKRFLNTPGIQDYIYTKRINNHYLPLNAKILFQPYGTFMDFSQPVYQDARICDLRYTPSAGFKKINNQDLFIIKNEKHNNSVIKSALEDFVIIDKNS